MNRSPVVPRRPPRGHRSARRAGRAAARALLLLPLPFLGGCATKGDLRELRTTIVAELDDVSARQDTLIRQVGDLRADLLDTVSLLERRGVSGRVELERRIEQLNADLARLIALTGQTQRLMVEIQRTAPAGDGGAVGAFGDGTPGDTTGAPGETAAAGEPEEVYEASLRQFRRGSFETARAGLREFLERFPNDELAPDARFYLAETYAATGDPETALSEFARILELHPDSRRAPAALYRMAEIELERGDEARARQHFERVLQVYPDSDEAGLVPDRLERLDG